MAMKILCTGDWHTRATAPRYRIDKYYQVQMQKLKWIFELGKKEDCICILQPGDFWDGPDVPNHVERDIIHLIYQYNIDVYSVFGQHDTKYRSQNNTALAVLAKAEVIDILGTTPIEYKATVHIYGVSWEQEIPKIRDKKVVNILVLHKMIVEGKPLWQEQTNYTKASVFLKKCKDFDLIVSGDNHNSFMVNAGNQFLINCGSLMRMTAAQRKHKPCVWIYDTETKDVKQHFIPIAPVEEVFSEKAEEIKEQNEELEAFVTILATDKEELSVSFEDNVEILIVIVNKEVKDLAHEFLANYYGEK